MTSFELRIDETMKINEELKLLSQPIGVLLDTVGIPREDLPTCVEANIREAQSAVRAYFNARKAGLIAGESRELIRSKMEIDPYAVGWVSVADFTPDSTLSRSAQQVQAAEIGSQLYLNNEILAVNEEISSPHLGCRIRSAGREAQNAFIAHAQSTLIRAEKQLYYAGYEKLSRLVAVGANHILGDIRISGPSIVDTVSSIHKSMELGVADSNDALSNDAWTVDPKFTGVFDYVKSTLSEPKSKPVWPSRPRRLNY